MANRRSITIKDLHEKTGQHVRRAGRGRSPMAVTDRGKVVAALVPPGLLPPRRRSRKVLSEYAALLDSLPPSDVLGDLDVVRGDR